MNKAKKGFWGIFLFYFFVAFEFAYMAGPFAVYFYSVYSPVLKFLNRVPALAWTIKFFLPHAARDTASPFINAIEVIGVILSVIGFLIFVIGACQIYYSKLTKKGAVLGGLYKYIRHPQYTSFIVCSFGLLLLWPRYIVVFFFVTLVFGYYFLARAEEKECERKFGESYIAYEQKTGRFFPKRPTNRSAVKLSGVKVFLCYLLTLLCFYLAAFGLNALTIQSLYAQYTPNSAAVSLGKIEQTKLNEVLSIAKKNTEVERYLESAQGGELELSYVLPTEWYAAEIPMNGLSYHNGHKANRDYNPNEYKIIFTKPELNPGSATDGKSILWNTVKINPIVEVWVDLRTEEVTAIMDMPEEIKYDGIPEAIY